jgi:hypothetical protein
MSMDEGRRSLCLAFAYGGLVSWRPALLFAAAVAVIGWARSAAARAGQEVAR